MRVTNGMMRTNAMLNMQRNKVAYDKYLQQYNTQKKIQRPSDDPTIAVRALKYRTTLTEIEQYQRNIDDATSWMDATETAIKDVDKVLDNMVEYVTQAATGTVNAKDRADINKQLDQYAQYIYEQDMNADYAGRYLFTGFRTDSPLLFKEAQNNVIYTIHEPLDIRNIRQYSYVYGRPEYETISKYNGDDSVYPPNATKPPEKASVPDTVYASEAPEFRNTNRILLSYQDLCDNSSDVYEELGNSTDNRLTYMTPTIVYKDRDGNECSLEVTVKSVISDSEEGNKYNEHLNAQSGTNSSVVKVRDKDGYIIDEKTYGDVFFVPETGELVFADDIYDDIRGGSDLMITYQKRDFDKNDIRPEHYFTCETIDIGTTDDSIYNTDQYYITATDTLKDSIGYDDMSLENAKAISNALRDIDKLDPNSPTYSDDVKNIVSAQISPAMQSEMIENVKNYMQAKLSTDLYYDALKERLWNNIQSSVYDEITSPQEANHIRQAVEAQYYETDEDGNYKLELGKHVYKTPYTEADFNQAVLNAFKNEYDNRLAEKEKELPSIVRKSAEEWASKAVEEIYDDTLTVAENLAKMDLFMDRFSTERKSIEDSDKGTVGSKLNLYTYSASYPISGSPSSGPYDNVDAYMNAAETDYSNYFIPPYSNPSAQNGSWNSFDRFFKEQDTSISPAYGIKNKDGYTDADYAAAQSAFISLKKNSSYPISKIFSNAITETNRWINNTNQLDTPTAKDKITNYENTGITQEDIDNLVNNLVNKNGGDNYDLVEHYSLTPTKVGTTGASTRSNNTPKSKGDVQAITDLLTGEGGLINEYIKGLAADKLRSGTPLPWDYYSRYAFRPQDIRYQINFSQTVQVNTEGRNAVGTEVGRGIEDVKNSCNELDIIEAKMSEVTKRIADLDEGKDGAEIASLNELKSKLQTQMDLQKSVLVKALGSMITTIQGAKDKINVALADHGSRYNRMVMTKNKIEELEIDTNQAKSDNEDADIGEAYINFTESNMLYQATLNATSKVLGQSLLDFI